MPPSRDIPSAGKTATSETIPRSAHRYISSFLGFTPAENPTVLGICVIHDPQGVYYGGTVAAPVIRDIFAKYPALPWSGTNGNEPVTDIQERQGKKTLRNREKKTYTVTIRS
ncbi:MAG: penicillin-binding transpeptidase domain-containing protein [Blautia sp.]